MRRRSYTLATFGYEQEKVQVALLPISLLLRTKGGHSGDDINKGLGNSIKIINRFLGKEPTNST